jgi:hypothetical protein
MPIQAPGKTLRPISFIPVVTYTNVKHTAVFPAPSGPYKNKALLSV